MCDSVSSQLHLLRLRLHYPTLSTTALKALTAVRHLFHSFLTDDDAARLLHTSHTVSLALLNGYTFASHTFQSTTFASLRCLRDLCLRYGMRIHQLATSQYHDDPSSLSALPGQLSPIPASVLSLSLGLGWPSHTGWDAFSATAADWYDREEWRLPEPNQSAQTYGRGEDEQGWWQTLWARHDGPLPDNFTDVDRDGVRYGACDYTLPLSLLPKRLRVLRFNSIWDQTFEPGCLAPNLTFLQLPRRDSVSLPRDVLPASLRFLSTRAMSVNGQYRRIAAAAAARLAAGQAGEADAVELVTGRCCHRGSCRRS